jgi:hypothetical protein
MKQSPTVPARRGTAVQRLTSVSEEAPEATPEAIARWMAVRVQRDGLLQQRLTARQISEWFGEEFTYTNKNNNLGIDRRVLKAFGDITGYTVIWVRRGYYWRKREPGDAGSRRQG